MRNRWLILASLFLIRTLGGVVYQSVASTAPLLMKDLRIGYGQLGMLIGLYSLPGVVMALPAGLLGKRFGYQRILVVGLAAMAVGELTMSQGRSYPLVASGRLLTGAGSAVYDVMLVAMVADWFAGLEITTAMAILMSSWPFGISLGLVALGPLSLASSWQQVMRLVAGLCLAGVALAAIAYRSPPGTRRAQDGASLRFTLSGREIELVALIAVVWALFNVGFIILPNFAPAFLTSVGFSMAQAGALVSVATWLVIPALPAGGYLAERLRRPNAILVVCFLGLGLTMWLIPLSSYPLGHFVALALLFGPPVGIIMALPVEVLAPANRSVGMGFFGSCYAAANTALVALAGLSRDITQSSAAPLFFGGTLLFVALFVFWLFRILQKRAGRGWQPEAIPGNQGQ